MRLERVIQIKKLLFVRTILVMKDDELPKQIFCERAKVYFLNPQMSYMNKCNSAVFDLLNVSNTFGLLGTVRDMIERQHFYTKASWREVWNRG